MLLVKILKNFHRFLLRKIGQENVFDDSIEGKNLFEMIKTRILKVEKLGFFQTYSSMVLSKKLKNFHLFR